MPKNIWDYDFDKYTEKVFKPANGFSSAYFGCRHWRQGVMVGRHIITCSGSGVADADKSATEIEPPPDFGIYLDTRWNKLLGDAWTNGVYSKHLAVQRPYPALVIDWPDMQPLAAEKLAWLVNYTMSRMSGNREVDIGCWHGHGRTGTLLACLLIRYERMTGTEAIDAVHDRYCKWAIETEAQRRSIHNYSSDLIRGSLRRA